MTYKGTLFMPSACLDANGYPQLPLAVDAVDAGDAETCLLLVCYGIFL